MSVLSQMFPPAPKFTEQNLGDLRGKVFIATGAAAGVGLELAKILYSKNATVYIGARSLSRCNEGITKIKKEVESSRGVLKPLAFDLSNLKTLQPAIESFKKEENRLDVLFLNAAVMTPPKGSKTVDGYDLEMGTNCLGSYLLVRLLGPTMQETSFRQDVGNGAVRIVWVSSCLDFPGTPKGGIIFDDQGAPKQLEGMTNYMQSKAGMLLLAHELSKKSQESGVSHVTLHPGFMKTELQRHMPPPARLLMSTVFKGPKYGAYTEMYAGLSYEVENGAFYIPWGRKGNVPDHLIQSMKNGVSGRFVEWCEEQVKPFF